MQADEVDHIRADIQQAILEAQHQDPTVTLEILWRLFDAVMLVSVAPSEAFAGQWYLSGDMERAELEDWADAVLRAVQLRAISKVPYGEPTNLDSLEDQP